MTSVSALNNVHKKGYFGNYENKNQENLLKLSEIKNLFIFQIVQYKNSPIPLDKIEIDSLKLKNEPMSVINNKDTRILDIGCGRANIISFLQKKYKFKTKAVGIDVLKNKNTQKNILFKKSDALKYLKKGKKFDVIIIKQTIHFFSKTKIVSLLNFAKKNLN